MAITFEQFMTDQGIDKKLTVKAQRALKNSEYRGCIKTTFSGTVMIDGDFGKMGAYIKDTCKEEPENQQDESSKECQYVLNDPNARYNIKGARGRNMRVYPDRVVITVTGTLGSLLTGNITDGEKTIFFHDVIGIQFKYTGAIIGYIQFETACGLMNNSSNNLFNENTFTYDNSNMDAQMTEIKDYIIEQVARFKQLP